MFTFEASFCDAEAGAFGFLASEHGFDRVARTVDRIGVDSGLCGRVVYRHGAGSTGSTRTVSLHVAPLRLELGLEISGHGSGEFSVEELHALDGDGPFPRREHGLYDAVHDPQVLASEFARLAAVLRASGTRFFADDESLWAGLEKQRQRRVDDEEVKRTLVLARASFHDRDWPRVVDLLSPIATRLGSRASARLAYARRKTQGDG